MIIKYCLKCIVNPNLSEYLLLFQILGVYLGVEFQTHPIMNIKRNIIFALESRKKNGVPIVENVPIRMRVIYASQRIEFTTGCTFVINGAERVIVSQLVRSPGIYYGIGHDKIGKKLFSCTVIPNREIGRASCRERV